MKGGVVAVIFVLCLSIFGSHAIVEQSIENSVEPLHNQKFNNIVAYALLMLSYAAYCPYDALSNWSCYWCTYGDNSNYGMGRFNISNVFVNYSTSTYGFGGTYTDIVMISFRGTDNLENWITDLHFAKTRPYPKLPNAVVHDGFMDAWESVKEQVVETILNCLAFLPNNQTSRYIFTGHSLGAALAELAAVDLITDGILNAPVTIYDYGAPRVGNNVFASYTDKLIPVIYRNTNAKDIVPHLPEIELGFWHPYQEVWWHNTSYQLCSTTTGEDPNCADSDSWAASISDHLDYLGIHLDDGDC